MASNPGGNAAWVFADCSRRLGGEYLYSRLHEVGLIVVGTCCTEILKWAFGGHSVEWGVRRSAWDFQVMSRWVQCCGKWHEVDRYLLLPPSSLLEGNMETLGSFGALMHGITIQTTAVFVISVEMACRVEASGEVGVTEVSVMARRPGSPVWFPAGAEILLMYTAPRPALEPTLFTILWVAWSWPPASFCTSSWCVAYLGRCTCTWFAYVHEFREGSTLCL